MVKNVDSRSSLLNLLKSYIDLDYRRFQIRIGIPQINLLGVRMPILKKIAKLIVKDGYLKYFNYNQNITYEEKIIYALVIGQISIDFKSLMKLLDDFIPNMDSWSVCDTLVVNLKIWKNNLDVGYDYIKNNLNKNNVWCNRFSFVMLLRYYISDKYIDEIIDICINYNTKEYYVKMAISWLLAECYYYYPDKIKQLLNNDKLEIWIHNKTIQKIKESNKISDDLKMGLLRR